MVISEILGLFVNALTADDQYSLLSRGNLLQHLQMQLSQKQKALFQFLVACPKLRLNFELFKNKDDLHSLRTFELPDDDD